MPQWINPYNFVWDISGVKRTEPIWHDKFDPQKFSGYIECRLRTLTPLFIPNPEDEIRDGNKHQTLEWFKINNQYAIPSTSLKGMLRSVVEALSGSCYAVFDDGRLEYRALGGVQFLSGIVTKMPQGNQPGQIQQMKRARVSIRDLETLDQSLKTGDTVYFQLASNTQSRGRERGRRSGRSGMPKAINIQKRPGTGFTEGTLKITTRKSFSKKRYERIFYDNEGTYYFTSDAQEDYNKVLRGQLQHSERKSGTFVTPVQSEQLREGNLVYFLPASNKPKYVNQIALAEVGRIHYNTSRGKLLPQESHPCTGVKELCPACRIFGMVGDEEAYAGRVSIGMAKLIGEAKVAPREITLKILSSPKPTSYQFYLIDDTGENDRVVRYDKDKNAVLRGRKFYWHHPDYSSDISYYEHPQRERSNQNRTVTPLLSGNTFEFTVEFENLEKHELGLLFYTLQLEEDMGHKLGMGKPLGFGSIKIDPELHLLDRKERYLDIFALPDEHMTDTGQYIEAFQQWLEDETGEPFYELNNILDLLDILNLTPPAEVKYPPGGFEWFRRNQKTPLPAIDQEPKFS